MSLPFEPPLEPMLAKAADNLPSDDGWLFEPKWDGFRALVFRDGDEVYIQSRDLKPLDRYFPELAAPLKAAFPNGACSMERSSSSATALSSSSRFSSASTRCLAREDAGRGITCRSLSPGTCLRWGD